MSSNNHWDQRSGRRGLDRHNVETQHMSDKLYPHNNGDYSRGFDQLYINKDPYYTHPKAYYDLPRSDASEKKLKEPKRLPDIFERFSDTTSLQGIPFIRAASMWYAKMVWSIIFIAAVVVWIYHSYVLIKSYVKFDTTSQVKITHETLDFPTITFCNINPIRENTISRFGGDQLEDLLDLLRPIEASEHDKRRKKRQSVGEFESIERDHDFSVFSSVNWTDYTDIGTFGEILEQGYSDAYLAKYLLQELLIQLPDDNRTMMGHRLGDMMLGCSYDGKTCSGMNFTRFLDISYGNCFSFNSAVLHRDPVGSTSSGSNFGLDIILYIQQREYMKGIQQGRGLRLLVHPFHTQPFVEDSGISIPTGFQTYVGLRQVQQTRLDGNYGPCGDGGKYEQFYANYTYTLEGCTKTCVDRTVTTTCKCYLGSRKQFYGSIILQTLDPCETAKELQCADSLRDDFMANKFDCECNQACLSNDYEYLLSYDQWPDTSLWHSLADAVCISASNSDCDTIQMTDDDDRKEFLRDNFVHLKIYYRDLNRETITEVESYEDIQFYSDMGGAIGLWLGASIITLFELGDLVFRCVQYFAKRNTYKKRKELKKRYVQDQPPGYGLASMHSSTAPVRRIQDEEYRSNHSNPHSNRRHRPF